MFALQRVSLKSSLQSWPGQVRGSVAPAGCAEPGRLPTVVPPRASSFKEKVWCRRRKNKHMEKYLGLLIMTFRGPFPHTA